MSDIFETKAKKMSAKAKSGRSNYADAAVVMDQFCVNLIEVLGADGSHIAGKSVFNDGQSFKGMGGIHVMKMGPVTGLIGLVLLPVIIPIVIIGFILLGIFAMLFGRAFVNTISKSGMI